MKPGRVLAGLGLAVLVTAVAVTSLARRAKSPPSAELLPYQAPVRGLPAAQRELFARLGPAIRKAEQLRSASGQWPATLEAPGARWVQRRHGGYVNYLGLPSEPDGQRWLVLFIEPAPAAIRDPAPPEDEEHHTLADGTALHLSIWTAPDEGPPPEVVLPFPAAEGWTQRLSR